MNPKQARFVAEYMVDRCGAAAARRAGYAASCAKVTASRLLTKDNLRAQIEALEHAEAQRLELSRQKVVERLVACVELAKAQAAPAAMIAAWREIGRILGYYVPERQLRRAQSHGLRAMSDADLALAVKEPQRRAPKPD